MIHIPQLVRIAFCNIQDRKVTAYLKMENLDLESKSLQELKTIREEFEQLRAKSATFLGNHQRRKVHVELESKEISQLDSELGRLAEQMDRIAREATQVKKRKDEKTAQREQSFKILTREAEWVGQHHKVSNDVEVILGKINEKIASKSWTAHSSSSENGTEDLTGMDSILQFNNLLAIVSTHKNFEKKQGPVETTMRTTSDSGEENRG